MTGSGDGQSPGARQCAGTRPTAAIWRGAQTFSLLLCASLVASCSSAERGASGKRSYSPSLGVSASPRVIPTSTSRARSKWAGALPKGGGHRKIGQPYKIGGRWYTPRKDPNYDKNGIASWYGTDFHGRLTANGEVYDMNALTAAHKTLPLPSYAYVTNLNNNRTVLVRINDRGPYAGNRIIDLSRATANALDLQRAGLGRVRVQYAGPAPLDGNDHHERKFLAAQNWAGQNRFVSTVPRAAQSRIVRAPQRAQSYPPQHAAIWDPHRYRRSLGR
ncbi:MAG: septal ring lytic transglycosylase RlpA family protein [Alphaproteobacteria bacterium]|nr:septal ring lytic transglycosylase RlpA family protein [Alphaproteobacteria bacterium]